MNERLDRKELASYAHGQNAQIDFELRAKRFLKAVGKSPSRPVSAEAKDLHRSVRAAVKYLSRQQRDYREMCAADVMPYYEALTDTLANLVCEMWAYIEQSETEADADI